MGALKSCRHEQTCVSLYIHNRLIANVKYSICSEKNFWYAQRYCGMSRIWNIIICTMSMGKQVRKILSIPWLLLEPAKRGVPSGNIVLTCYSWYGTIYSSMLQDRTRRAYVWCTYEIMTEKYWVRRETIHIQSINQSFFLLRGGSFCSDLSSLSLIHESLTVNQRKSWPRSWFIFCFHHTKKWLKINYEIVKFE